MTAPEDFALPPGYHPPRLYSGVVWADVVADIRAGATVSLDDAPERDDGLALTEVAW